MPEPLAETTLTYSADYTGNVAALLRHLAEAHEVLGVDPADAVARHDLEHVTVDDRYVTARWIDQHGHSCHPTVLA